MNITFINENGPSLLIHNKKKILAVADLHFGIESGFARQGVHIHSRSSERMDRLQGLIRENDHDLLLILGDFKHCIPYTSRQEMNEIPSLIKRLRDVTEFAILPGNHDAGLKHFLRDEELLPATGSVIDGVGYMHGHTKPGKSLAGHLIVAGHHHPVISLYDSVGVSLRANPAYVYTTLDEECLKKMYKNGFVKTERDGGKTDFADTRMLLVPSYSELSGGIDIFDIKRSGISPISRCMNNTDAEVMLPDGTYVGTMQCLNEGRRNTGQV